MDRTKRLLFQAFLWLTIWLVGWYFVGAGPKFLIDNGLSFIFQILIVSALIYFIAPKLLFEKKYALFVLVSVILILICAFIISGPFQGPPPKTGPGLGPRLPPKAPPKILINLLVLSIAYVLATFIETFLFAQKKEEETIRNKNENLQTELKLLKSQINPHFLFNALNNIYALSVTDSNKTQQGISTLSDMLRYVLYECEQPFVPIQKEIDYIEDYLEMFALKSSKAFPIKTDFRISDPSVRIAPMLFIPFVENAMKHGNIEKGTDGFLDILIVSGTKKVEFQIENSLPKNTVQKDDVGGIGLENVKKRLQILYPQRHTLEIREESAIFKVKLKLSLDGKD